MPEIIAGFDILGLATAAGALLFVIALLWVVVDNRSFDDLNRRHAERTGSSPRTGPGAREPGAATTAEPPTRPSAGGGTRRGRAA